MMQVMNGCGVCEFGPMTALLPMIEYINAVTGWDLSADEYFEIGERILSLRKAFNVREGIKPDDTRLHDRAIGKNPLKQGPLKGITIDIDNLQTQFFNAVGWDIDTGGPTEAKMKELGIDHLFT